MKNFNFGEVHWKIQFLGLESWKTNIEQGIALKGGGAWTVCWFKGEFDKKEVGGVFEGEWYPNAHTE